MAGPFTETYTIGLPTATQEEIDGLIAAIKTLAQKYAEVADALKTAIPAIQGSVQEIADAAKAIKPHWPL
jgi:hypothetical protein